MLNTTSAAPKKYKIDTLCDCMPKTLRSNSSPTQSAFAAYEIIEMEKITKPSVISRTAGAERSMGKKRFRRLFKNTSL
jgi:hypothetical protein